MNKGNYFANSSKIFLTFVNLVILGIACAIVCFNYYYTSFILLTIIQCGLGLYVSGKSIHESASTASWTCANNA